MTAVLGDSAALETLQNSRPCSPAWPFVHRLRTAATFRAQSPLPLETVLLSTHSPSEKALHSLADARDKLCHSAGHGSHGEQDTGTVHEETLVW